MPGYGPESPGLLWSCLLSRHYRECLRIWIFFIRAFEGLVFVYVAVLSLSCSTAELHCILQDLFLFSSNVASPIQWT